MARSHETIGFLYYSGHGCQLDNVGYLVPTNINTKKKLDIKYDAMNIDKMLETLDSAGNRVNMLFLDACRDVPTNAKGSTKGLGQAPQRPKGTLLVYATEAGKTAEDNSKFINALISNINKPNKNIRDIAYDISNEVADQTSEGQIPEVFAKRLPEVVLNRGGDMVKELINMEKERKKEADKVARIELYNSFALLHIEFKYNSMDLTLNSKELLANTAKIMKKYRQFKYKIQAHTDDRGAARFNLALSFKRAEKVKDFLVSKGIESTTLIAEGFGETEPIRDNSTREGRLENRRIVFKII